MIFLRRKKGPNVMDKTKWHSWFARWPVPVARVAPDKVKYAWWQPVERRYVGLTHIEYRLPGASECGKVDSLLRFWAADLNGAFDGP